MRKLMADPLRREDLQLAWQILLVELACLLGFLLIRNSYRGVVARTAVPAAASAAASSFGPAAPARARVEAVLTPSAPGLNRALRSGASAPAAAGTVSEKETGMPGAGHPRR